MNRKVIFGFILLLFITWGIGISFSTTKICSYDYGFGIKDYPQTTHDCVETNSNFCYTPKSGFENLAPTSEPLPFQDPIAPLTRIARWVKACAARSRSIGLVGRGGLLLSRRGSSLNPETLTI